MEFTNHFTIPVGIEDTFAVLTDLERVAPCMPGTVLKEVEGDTFHGTLKVKVGPMNLTYKGWARLAERDPEAYTGRIEASGRENRGVGTAAAEVRASLVEEDGQTTVTVVTGINVTGRPAQFGRAVLAAVGARIIDRFAENLRDELSSSHAADGALDAVSREDVPDGSAAASPTSVAHRPPRDDAVHLVGVASQVAVKRLAPVAAVLGLAVIWLRLRWRRGDVNRS